MKAVATKFRSMTLQSCGFVGFIFGLIYIPLILQITIQFRFLESFNSTIAYYLLPLCNLIFAVGVQFFWNRTWNASRWILFVLFGIFCISLWVTVEFYQVLI